MDRERSHLGLPTVFLEYILAIELFPLVGHYPGQLEEEPGDGGVVRDFLDLVCIYLSTDSLKAARNGSTWPKLGLKGCSCYHSSARL